jgi:hypothetical protein
VSCENEEFRAALDCWLQSVAVVSLGSAVMPIKWDRALPIGEANWTCGHCGDKTGMGMGWKGDDSLTGGVAIRPCGGCGKPTFFLTSGETVPKPMPGRAVPSAPGDTGKLYEEARRAAGAQAHTACAMACRAILLHVAVEQGAEKPKNFAACIEWLLANGYLPPNARHWLHLIRDLGNEANHDLTIVSTEQATQVLALTEHLLRTIYELPGMVPQQEPESAP